MSLADEVYEYVRAACPGIFIQSVEDELCIQEMQKMCEQHGLLLAVYDVDNTYIGSNLFVNSEWYKSREGIWRSASGGPTAALRDAGNIQTMISEEMERRDVPRPSPDWPRATVVLLRNYSRRDLLLDSTLHTQILQNLCMRSKVEGFRIIIQGPVYKLPPEVERYFRLVEHKLPCVAALRKLALGIEAQDAELKVDEADWPAILEAAAGLTSYEASDAFALSFNRYRSDPSLKPLDPNLIWEHKATSLRKQGLLEILEQPITFETLGGVDYLRDNCLELLNYRDEDPEMKPKGVLLSGVPGTGKSAFAVALGHATNRKVIALDMGKMRSKYSGESEGNIRQALAMLDAMQPCIALFDEVEKALSGAASSGETDGGMGDRILATLLTWLNNHTSDVFVLCTSNNPWTLPSAFSRAERFDDSYFFDAPDEDARRKIWEIYLKRFLSPLSSRELDHLVESSNDWTGAEIKSCCKRARRGTRQPKDYLVTVPLVLRKDPAGVQQMRTWAAGVCLRTDKPGLYGSQARLAPTVRGKLNLKSLNSGTRKLV